MPTPQETLIETRNARVRIMLLAPGEMVPWHFHSQITDDIFCLEGAIEIGLKAPEGTSVLAPGKRCRVLPRRVHRVVNASASAASYLLVQGGGDYDFKESAG